jgi:hypothetical protein
VKAKQGNAEAEFGDVLAAGIGGRRGGWISAAIGVKSTNVAVGPFTHSEDYRSVTLRGKTHTLTSQQAQMIEILHEAHKNGNPDVSIAHIQERLEKNNSRWQDTFKSNPKAKKALVISGARKGTLRLNV